MRFIGCKKLLLKDIKSIIDSVAPSAKTFCDIFSGTATVARYFKQWYEITSNDLLYFSYCLQMATIENDKVPSFEVLYKETGINNPFEYFVKLDNDTLETLPQEQRFFQNNYAPIGNRMYISDVNALRFDFVRNRINDWYNDGFLTENEYYYLVACAVEGLPFVSNIRGTYGAYAKDWDKRSYKIYEPLFLDIITNGKTNRSFNEDGASLLKRINGDILYIDPPYNARQYLPNYHVLETAAKYDYPKLNGITGQRAYEEQKSDFCIKSKVENAFFNIMSNANYQHIIFSYNTDGLMAIDAIEEIMKVHGIPNTYKLMKIPYRRYKSRSETEIDGLKELLFYIEKKV